MTSYTLKHTVGVVYVYSFYTTCIPGFLCVIDSTLSDYRINGYMLPYSLDITQLRHKRCFLDIRSFIDKSIHCIYKHISSYTRQVLFSILRG